MASIKYYRVTRLYNGRPDTSEVVTACNYLEAQDEGEKAMPFEVRFDAEEMNDAELTHHFKTVANKE